MDRTVQILKALAEPTRLRIVALCQDGGDLAVSEFVRILGQSQPRVSRHLRLLTEAGVLSRLPEGSWVFYRISNQPQTHAIVAAVIDGLATDDTVRLRDRERLNLVKIERAQAADAYFSANAAAWSDMRAMHIDQTEVNAALRGLLADTPVGTLLDIGTGTGEMLNLFADRFDTGEGIDMSRDMLAVARPSLEKAGLTHCHVRHGDLYSLPYEDQSFDAVIIHQVLHFADDIVGAIAEAGRVLADGGRMIIADFARHDIEDLRSNHQHRRLGFTDDDFDTGIVRAGLEKRDVLHLKGDPLTVTIWLMTKPLAGVRQSPAA